MNRYIIIILLCFSCKKVVQQKTNLSYTKTIQNIDSLEQINYHSLFKKNKNYISDGFDFPVGKPNAKGYYNAQKFQENNHLGDDWNGVKGGNSDLGDPIYAISNGYITVTKDFAGGWGNIVRIVHLYNDKLYESLYAHCDSILVTQNTFIKKGEQIATIGNCNGVYYAHLHLELRDTVDLDIGNGYAANTKGYLDPTLFIKKNRK